MRSRTDFDSVHVLESESVSYRRPLASSQSSPSSTKIPRSPLGPIQSMSPHSQRPPTAPVHPSMSPLRACPPAAPVHPSMSPLRAYVGSPHIRSHAASPHPALVSPFRQQSVSPYRLPQHHAGTSPYVQQGRPPIPVNMQSVSPLRLSPYEKVSSNRKRARSESVSSRSSASDYEYSSSDDGEPSPKMIKAPSPPKYYPNGPEEEEEIGSSDSDYEDEIDAKYDDLRDFIDFDPEFNHKVITKREKFSKSQDPLREFLFHHDGKSRKWFRTFAWAAVGPKLTKKNSN